MLTHNRSEDLRLLIDIVWGYWNQSIKQCLAVLAPFFIFSSLAGDLPSKRGTPNYR